jgi:ABC-type nitrate/sulfonate/bicarbonate transport system substrate-binding protein
MFRTIVVAIVAAALCAGCGKGNDTSGGANRPKVTLQLNWKPEPQFGGFYAAEVDDIYARHGLDVTITAGGAGAPTVDMIGAGTVPFAIVSADEIVRARAIGNLVVALFAVYQTNPRYRDPRLARIQDSCRRIYPPWHTGHGARLTVFRFSSEEIQLRQVENRPFALR